MVASTFLSRPGRNPGRLRSSDSPPEKQNMRLDLNVLLYALLFLILLGLFLVSLLRRRREERRGGGDTDRTGHAEAGSEEDRAERPR